MKFKESIAVILILTAILSVCFVTAATTAYVHIINVTDTPSGLVINANITTDENGTALIPSGYGIQAKYMTVSSTGQPSSAGSAYTTNGIVQFLIANRHTYDYDSITVSFDDYYPGNYTANPDTWINSQPSGPNIDVSTNPGDDSVNIGWEVDTPIFVNNSTSGGGTNTTYDVTVTDNNGDNTTVTGNITFNENETTDDPTKINSNGTINGTININLPKGNYTGQFIVNGNAEDGRKSSSSPKFSFSIGDNNNNNTNLVPLQRTGLPLYSLIVTLLGILFLSFRRT